MVCFLTSLSAFALVVCSTMAVPKCQFVSPKESTAECKRYHKPEGDLPLCVGVRGNGPRLWAHFPSLARVVEAFGPIHGMAGGSSATVTGFLLESIEANPFVTQCGTSRCCGATKSNVPEYHSA